MNIGKYLLPSKVLLAPMAGTSDKPFRMICREQGAALTTSEMVVMQKHLLNTNKSKHRLDFRSEQSPISIQIAGSESEELAESAKQALEFGADIIDINMGCPAKKVNKKLAGSALLKVPKQVEQIVKAVVDAVSIPVTLKIRTGWCENSRNGIEIAKIAEANGIQSLAVHGRTRCDFYKGAAEYDTIKAIKQAVSIPVVANGDITSVEKAEQVLSYTGADAIMIGRAAQGRPWIFREINHFLKTGTHLSAPTKDEIGSILIGHVNELHTFYGEFMGVRIARKHVSWYMQQHDQEKTFRSIFNGLLSAEDQLESLNLYFEH